MKNIIYFLFTGIIIFLLGCEKMNDKHDKYLENGEIVYIGMVDSLKAFPGNDRILFRYWLSDPRAKTLNIYWSNKKDSMVVPITPHAAIDSFDIYVDKKNVNITEGNYTFQWISCDDKSPRNKSVVFEKNANVYGARYQSRLTNHIIKSAEANGNNVVLTWAGATSTQEIDVEIVYEKRSGETVTEKHSVAGLQTTTLTNVKFEVSPQYRTRYLPEPHAIDTFSTAYAKIPFSAIVNVTQGKPVTASDILDPLNATQQPANAVDGRYGTGDSRWVSTAAGEHWLEIDLQDEYSINSFKTWNGSGGYNNPIAQLKLQAWINDDWVDIVSVTNNADAQYGASFNAVTTNKVRFYTYNQVRLYEIAVYSVINY